MSPWLCKSSHVVVQLLSWFWISVTPRTAGHQASLSFPISACSNSHPSSQWCHPTISSSVMPLSSCPQSFPGAGSFMAAAAAAAKSLQSCLTLCDPTDGSPPGSAIPGILQARTPEWVAISFSNAWKWKVKVKLLSRVRLPLTPWTAAHQASLSINNSRSLLKLMSIWVGDAIQPSHPLLSPSPPALNLSKPQSLFKWVSSLHQVAKVLEFQLLHQSFQWIFRIDFL